MCELLRVIRARKWTMMPCMCSISARRTLARLQSMLVSLSFSLSLSLSPCLSVWLLLYMPVYAHAYAHAHQFSARVDYRRQTRRVLRNDRSKRCRQDDGNQYAHRVFFIIDKFPVPTASTLLQENFHPYLQTA